MSRNQDDYTGFLMIAPCGDMLEIWEAAITSITSWCVDCEEFHVYQILY